MHRKILLSSLGVLCLLAFTTTVSAEAKFSWGGAERIRHEYWKNMADVSNQSKDTRNFFRIKSSLWGKADFDENFSLFTKLTNEFKAYTYFGGATGSVPDKTASKKGYHFDINEIVFDNLYADIKNVFDLPVNLRLGRQDFLGTYGEGFLIMDGTPQDGSRTFYFNAAKASWKVNETNTLDFIYMNNPRDEELLPVINRLELENRANPAKDKVPQLLNTTDEQAYVIYLKNKDIEKLDLEAYYILKREDNDGGAGIQSNVSHINTIGAFAKYDLGSCWTLRGQLASQFGDDGDDDRRAMGGYAFIDKSFKDAKWTPKLSLGYMYLSGDDPSTTKKESWNPLFSRYPWISELYVITIMRDSNVGVAGYWTNLSAIRAELSLKLTEKTKISFDYNYLRANETVASSSVCSGASKERGHLPQIRVDYALTKNISTYFLAEYLIPGNFYNDNDAAVFLRSEIQIKF